MGRTGWIGLGGLARFKLAIPCPQIGGESWVDPQRRGGNRRSHHEQALRDSPAGGGPRLGRSGPPVVVAVPDLGQEDYFLARTIRGIAYVEDVEPVAAKVTLELVAFAKAQG